MNEIVYLGIDLGTSRTSITSSNGIRKTVWSYVGYPKDHVALKKFGGREIIFGKEAVENRMSLNLIRPLAGGSIKKKGESDSDAAKKALGDLIKHVVEIAEVPASASIYAVIGAPAEVSVEGKTALMKAASPFIDSIIICSEPFAVAYGLDYLDDTLIVDIGAGTVDLCRVHGTMPQPEDQRTHEVGGDQLDETLSEMIKEKYPKAQHSINMIRGIKEKFSSVSPTMDVASVTLTEEGKPKDFDLTEQIYRACYTIIPPTVAALQDLISTYDPEFQHKMRNNILVGGGGSQIRGMASALESALSEYGGAKVTMVDEPLYAGSNGALRIALDMPEKFWVSFKKEKEPVKA
ncbi:MAG: rod shape-determining protein [Planctomycetes bacterium]|nr:rod shape-determining protein [Planctomycetota bacterium]